MDLAGVNGEDEYRECIESPGLAPRQLAAPCDVMMGSDSGPLGALSDITLVARVISDVNQADEKHRDALLAALLSAAWPSHWALNQ